MSVFFPFHPYRTQNIRKGEEGRKEGRGRGYKGQYVGKHLHGIETMSRFHVARGQFFKGALLECLDPVDFSIPAPLAPG